MYLAAAKVKKGSTVTVKLAIADVSDYNIASSVFIAANSLTFAADSPILSATDGKVDNSSGSVTVVSDINGVPALTVCEVRGGRVSISTETLGRFAIVKGTVEGLG